MKPQVWVQNGASTPMRKKVVDSDDCGHITAVRHVPNGLLRGDLHITIDLDRIIAVMGAKALKASSKRCVGLSGLVVVKARNVKHEPPKEGA